MNKYNKNYGNNTKDTRKFKMNFVTRKCSLCSGIGYLQGLVIDGDELKYFGLQKCYICKGKGNLK